MGKKNVVTRSKIHMYMNLGTPEKYELTSSEPADWSTSYTDYYTKSGESYTKVAGSSAPSWAASTYYKYTAAVDKFERMGHGWSKISENPNAQTESTQYVDSDTATTDTTSYEPNYAVECDLMAAEPTIKKVYDICQDRMTYDDCILDCVKVLAFEDTDGLTEVTAYREKLAVAISSIDGTKKMTMSGNLNGQGDGIKGKFNLKTLTFTPDEA